MLGIPVTAVRADPPLRHNKVGNLKSFVRSSRRMQARRLAARLTEDPDRSRLVTFTSVSRRGAAQTRYQQNR